MVNLISIKGREDAYLEFCYSKINVYLFQHSSKFISFLYALPRRGASLKFYHASSPSKKVKKKSAFFKTKEFSKNGFLLWNSGKKFLLRTTITQRCTEFIAIFRLDLLRKHLKIVIVLDE